MADLAEGWNGPFEVTIIAAGPQQFDGSPQWKGAYPPFKDVLQWNCRVEYTGGTKFVYAIFHADTLPEAGTKLAGAFIEHKPKKDKPGKFTTILYSAEQRTEKKASGGGFGGGGAKPNYSLEQEAYKDGQIAAITAIQGGLVGGDGKDLEMNLANIRKVTTALAKDILDAGKKSEAPQA